MILGSQSISNESQNFNDYRYQKALKQIGKLINVNRQIKTQSQKFKLELIQVHQKNEQLFQMNCKLQNQVQSLRNEYQTMRKSYQQLQNFSKSVEYQQKQLIKNKHNQTLTKIQMQNNHKAEIERIKEMFQQQISNLMVQMNQKDKQINFLSQKSQIIKQLEAQNNKLHQQYEFVLRENQQLILKVQQLSNEIINNSARIKQQPNQQLLNKLKINQDWIKSLNQQNYNLKQKILQDQYAKQKQKCNETIFQNMNNFKSFLNIPSHQSNDILVRQFLKQAQKKFKKVSQEKQNITTKYNKLKNKYNELQAVQHQNQRQLNLLKLKINGYQQLTQRQQSEIERMIAQFNLQMERLSNKNKAKTSSKNQLQQPSSPTRLLNKQAQLKAIIQGLERQITQFQSQSQQKIKLIQFLQQKIDAIQKQNSFLQQNNHQLYEQLASHKVSSDLSKTSKIYNKDSQLIKTQNLSKNGSKVFIINGKKYESKLLKANQNHQIEQIQTPINLISQQNMKKSLQFSQQLQNINYHTNPISYLSSTRNYQNPNINYMNRA